MLKSPEIKTNPAPEHNANYESSRVDAVLDASLLAFQGIRSAISTKRMEWAADRLERMDHKDALYSDLGYVSLHGVGRDTPTPAVNPLEPRTLAEKISVKVRDSIIDKKAQKKLWAETEKYRVDKIFGIEEDLPKSGKWDKRKDKALISASAVRLSSTARSRREAKTEIDAQRLPLGKTLHKTSSKDLKRTGKQLDRSLNQPVVSRWRSFRRREAIKDIQRHHRNAEKHRERQGDVLDTSRARRQRRDERSEKRWNKFNEKVVGPVARKAGKIVGKRRSS